MLTKKDFEELYKKFKTYTETAEQKEFALLFMLENGLLHVLKNFDKVDEKKKENTYKNVNWYLGGCKDDEIL